jgi:hypothetical protein
MFLIQAMTISLIIRIVLSAMRSVHFFWASPGGNCSFRNFMAGIPHYRSSHRKHYSIFCPVTCSPALEIGKRRILSRSGSYTHGCLVTPTKQKPCGNIESQDNRSFLQLNAPRLLRTCVSIKPMMIRMGKTTIFQLPSRDCRTRELLIKIRNSVNSVIPSKIQQRFLRPPLQIRHRCHAFPSAWPGCSGLRSLTYRP